MKPTCSFESCNTAKGLADCSLVPNDSLLLCASHRRRYETMLLGYRIGADAQFMHLFRALHCGGRRAPFADLAPLPTEADR